MLDLNDSRQAGIERRLREEEFAYFTTIRPDGSPTPRPSASSGMAAPS